MLDFYRTSHAKVQRLTVLADNICVLLPSLQGWMGKGCVAKSVPMTFVYCDTCCEILPVPPLSKEGTYKPPFVKGAAQHGGIFVGHCDNLVWFDLVTRP